MVGGQLHDEGGGIAREALGLFQHDAGDDDRGHADEVSRGGDPGRAAEERARDQADDGHFCAAGHEGRRGDRHAAVALVFNGARGHDAGDAAAGGDQHRDEALAGEAEAAEDPVHDEGDTGHVAAVLQETEHQEQHEHLGHEAEHRADAREDTVGNEADQPRSHIPALEDRAGAVLQPGAAQHVVRPVCQEGADRNAAVRNGGAHGQGVDQEHDDDEDRQGEDAVGDDLVDLVGDGELTLALFLINALEQLADVDVALVGDDALGVVVQLLFRGDDVVFNMRLDLVRDLQPLQHLFVALKELDGVPALPLLGQVMDRDLLNVGQRVLHRAGKAVLRDGLAVLRSLYRGQRRFLDAVTLQGGNLHDRAAELTAQFFHVDAVPGLFHKVHHVQRDDHGDTQLGELGGQIEVALQVGRVHDIEDGVGLLLNEIVPRHDLFQRVGREGVDAGQVGQHDLLVDDQLAFLLLHGHAGPVADELVGAGQLVEQGGLAAVRVAREGNAQLFLHGFLLLYSTSIMSASALRIDSS